MTEPHAMTMVERLLEGSAAERRHRRRCVLSGLDLPALEEVYRGLPRREGTRTTLTKAALIDVIVWAEIDALEGRYGADAHARLTATEENR